MHIIRYPEKGRFSPEGVVMAWDKNTGDAINKGDFLVQIEASGEWIQIESVADGALLKVLADKGRFVRSGDPLAVIGKAGEDISRAIKQLEQDKPAPAAKQAAKAQPKPKAKPAVAVQAVQSTQPKKEEVMTSPKSTGNPDNVIPILMPQAGQSMEEGTILSWKVKEGDSIEVGQVIMEIETDKATMEVEAVDAGRVAKIVSAEGDIVEVKIPVAYLAEEGVDVDAYIGSGGAVAPAVTSAPAKSAQTKTAAPAVQKTAASVSASGRVKASPAARKAATDKGIDLASIGAGSGPGGRILSSDVENADVIPTETQVHTLSKMQIGRAHV